MNKKIIGLFSLGVIILSIIIVLLLLKREDDFESYSQESVDSILDLSIDINMIKDYAYSIHNDDIYSLLEITNIGNFHEYIITYIDGYEIGVFCNNGELSYYEVIKEDLDYMSEDL